MALTGWLYIAVPLVEVALRLAGPFGLAPERLVYTDWIYNGLLALHVCAGIAFLARSRGRLSQPFLQRRLPELLFVLTLVLFLFSYIYASNANMGYVQRFQASGGSPVRLALDTWQERLASLVYFLPLLLLGLGGYLAWRDEPTARKGAGTDWGLPLTLLSVFLGTAAFPSFISLEGLPALAFVALVPLLLAVELSTAGWGLFYLTTFGVLQGMLSLYWLGTYSLITLQLMTLYFLLAYALFFWPVLWIASRLPALRFLVYAVGWTVFEYLRSTGFLGFPWALWGTTQYPFLALIQVASLAGVWAVSFLVVLVNAGLAAALAPVLRRESPVSGVRAALISMVPLVCALAFGAVSLYLYQQRPVVKDARVALVQQNSDPRKNDYRETFDTLKGLTDQAVKTHPDLVAWSETAFVPNIRRWRQVKPQDSPLAALVADFLRYQKSLGVWLVTGNDDYELIREGGREKRYDYNAAVLFAPDGRRVATYHKIHLVPFTEYFPWKEQLPQVYEMLQSFDVYLWEPGTERVVFQVPAFRFSTPICFEDSFPDDVRRFVVAGAEAIVNLSNDYWSLTEVEAKQHAVNAIFRAVENRTPLLRATASGLTCYVKPTGLVAASRPYYQATSLVVDVAFRKPQRTLYTLLGDWFPKAGGAFLVVLLVAALIRPSRRKE